MKYRVEIPEHKLKKINNNKIVLFRLVFRIHDIAADE